MDSLVRLAIFDCGFNGEKHARCLATLDGASVVARIEQGWSRAFRVLADGSIAINTPPTVHR